MTRLRPARLLSAQPTAGLPVKVSSRIRSSSTSGAASAVRLGTTLKAPSGNPEPCTMSASFRAESGVWLAGRSTMASPAASAGATLWATRFSG